MALDFGASLAKYLLCLFNFVFFLGGAVMLSIGVWLAVDKSSFIMLTKISEEKNLNYLKQPSVIEQGAYILIAAGAFVFIISFLGYCGAVKESRFLLTAYGMFLVIILALEVAAGVLAAMYKAEAEKETKEFLKFTLREYYTVDDQADAVTIAWDLMMTELRCCGVNNYTDFYAAKKWMANRKAEPFPRSCCKPQVTDYLKLSNCTDAPTDYNSNRNTGCYSSLLEWVRRHANIVIGVGVGVGLLQLFGIILAFCLCKAIDNDIK